MAPTVCINKHMPHMHCPFLVGATRHACPCLARAAHLRCYLAYCVLCCIPGACPITRALAHVCLTLCTIWLPSPCILAVPCTVDLICVPTIPSSHAPPGPPLAFASLRLVSMLHTSSVPHTVHLSMKGHLPAPPRSFPPSHPHAPCPGPEPMTSD